MADTLQSMVAAGERAAIEDRAREERIANCEMEFSDGFLSSWAAGLTQQKGRMAADLLAAGGTAFFWRCELVDAETGELIDGAKLIDGRFGKVWLMEGAAEQKYGRFIKAHAARKATMARKGVLERIAIFEAKATVILRGHGKGLAGATSVQALYALAEYDGTQVWHGFAGLTREDAEGWCEGRDTGYLDWQEKAIL